MRAICEIGQWHLFYGHLTRNMCCGYLTRNICVMAIQKVEFMWQLYNKCHLCDGRQLCRWQLPIECHLCDVTWVVLCCLTQRVCVCVCVCIHITKNICHIVLHKKCTRENVTRSDVKIRNEIYIYIYVVITAECRAGISDIHNKIQSGQKWN